MHSCNLTDESTCATCRARKFYKRLMAAGLPEWSARRIALGGRSR